MKIDPTFDYKEMTERFFAVIKSLNEFDKAELRTVINSLIGSKTDEETCYLGLYYRAVANVETLLALKQVKDVQAIVMIVRTLFELAVDSRLLGKESDSVQKLIAYSDLEKLRSANKIIKFKTAHPSATVDIAVYQAFVANETNRIEAEQKVLWPGLKLSEIQHWSAKRLDKRVDIVGQPFDQIYAVNYPLLSWYVHSGLTGVLNVQQETFHKLAGLAFTLAYECYMTIMADTIRVLKIDKAIDKIQEMMKLAKMLPFSDGVEEARALESELLR